MTREYPDQVGVVLRAYLTLIRHSRELGKGSDVDRYTRDALRYGQSLVRSGKDKEFPSLNQRMAQILTLGGYHQEAKEWAEAKPQ